MRSLPVHSTERQQDAGSRSHGSCLMQAFRTRRPSLQQIRVPSLRPARRPSLQASATQQCPAPGGRRGLWH
eukprot:1379194-Pleurochrysis_carterae.AAC.3